MFNFDLFSKSLTDERLEPSEFRVLSFILNTMSLDKTEKREFKAPEIAANVHLSDKTVRRAWNKLSDYGYFKKKELGKGENNRKGVLIVLPTLDTGDHSTLDTGDRLYNGHDNNHHGKEEKVSEVEGTDNFQDTHDNSMITKKENNRYVTGLFDELSELNKRYFECGSRHECDCIVDRFNNIWNDAMERYQQGYFTQPQVDALSRFYDNFLKATADKDTYFKQQQNKCR